jgi:hypothetical protein
MIVCEHSDDICNSLDYEIIVKVTISNYHGALTIKFNPFFDSAESLQYYSHWSRPKAGDHHSKLDV